MYKKVLAFVIAFLPAVAGFADEQKVVATYGGAVVEKVLGVDKGYIFRCDIKDWPDIIGADIPVKIAGIAPPLIVARQGRHNEFYELQAKKFIETLLADAKEIALENITRDVSFCIVADVIVDSNSVADMMIQKELARRPVPGEAVGSANSTDVGETTVDSQEHRYQQSRSGPVASKSSKVFHRPGCRFAGTISPKNIVEFGGRHQALQTGRRPCKTCKP